MTPYTMKINQSLSILNLYMLAKNRELIVMSSSQMYREVTEIGMKLKATLQEPKMTSQLCLNKTQRLQISLENTYAVPTKPNVRFR